MNNETFEKAYTTNEVSKILDIGSSTIRRWSHELEKNGYVFAKNNTANKRLFVERDIEMFKQFQKMVQDNNVTIVNASKLVVERFSGEALTGRAGSALPEKTDKNQEFERAVLEQLEDVRKELEEQKQFNMELKELVQKQQQYTEEKLEQRDRALMESFRATQEKQQLLLETAAAKEKNDSWVRKLIHLFKK